LYENSERKRLCPGETRKEVALELVLLQETQTETWDSKARKQSFIVQAQTQQTHVQRLSPENKWVSPYIPLQAGDRSNKKQARFNPYMVTCNSTSP
jgi:hypothetical protein